MNDPHATDVEIRRCARCRGTYVPFPLRASRLCPPCVYRVASAWPTDAELAATTGDIRELLTILRRLMTPGYPRLAFAPARSRPRRTRRAGARVGVRA